MNPVKELVAAELASCEHCSLQTRAGTPNNTPIACEALLSRHDVHYPTRYDRVMHSPFLNTSPSSHTTMATFDTTAALGRSTHSPSMLIVQSQMVHVYDGKHEAQFPSVHYPCCPIECLSLAARKHVFLTVGWEDTPLTPPRP